MGKYKKLISLLLILSMITALCSCKGNDNSSESETEDTTSPIDPVAVETYTSAIEALGQCTSYSRDIKIKTTKYIGNEAIVESIERSCLLSDTDTNEFTSTVTEKKFIKGEAVSTVEVFKAGNVYLEYTGSMDSLYTAKSSRDSYISSLIPLLPIDMELYDSVSTDSVTGDIIILEAPSSLESWVTDGEVTLNDATATIKMHSNGEIDSFTYTADYNNGIAHIVSQYVIDINTDVTPSSPVLHSHDSYKSVSDIRIPKLINDALCYANGDLIGSATSIVAASSYLTSKAIEITESYYTCGDSADDYMAKLCTSTVSRDGDLLTESSETKTYKNGILTLEKEGESSSSEAEADMLSNIISSSLSEHIISPLITDSSTISTEGSFYTIDLTGTDRLGLFYESYSSNLLHGSEDHLRSKSDSYSTKSITAYICIDKESMVPCSIGISFSGEHTGSGNSYPVYCNISKHIIPGDVTAYKEITGSHPTEAAPDKAPEPVLYRITSNKGGFVYILPSVTAGDEKTAFLPHELKTAVGLCSYVAIENNSFDMNITLNENKELRVLMNESYYYTDGYPAIERYSDSKLYTDSSRIMKAHGCYIHFDMMRPSLLLEHIRNDYLLSACGLRADKSAESRIVSLAGAAKMQVISMDPYESYIKKHSSYSAEAQEYILKALSQTGRQSYISHINSLYELWCNGDEVGLKEAIVSNALPADASEADYNAYTECVRIGLEEPSQRLFESIQGYLDASEKVFCVVDVNYFYRENGILDKLRSHDYTIDKVIYSAEEEEAE